jgi:hypothetical protein
MIDHERATLSGAGYTSLMLALLLAAWAIFEAAA